MTRGLGTPGVGDIFLAHFGLLSTSYALLIMSIPCASSDCYLQWDIALCQNTLTMSKWFLEH